MLEMHKGGLLSLKVILGVQEGVLWKTHVGLPIGRQYRPQL